MFLWLAQLLCAAHAAQSSSYLCHVHSLEIICAHLEPSHQFRSSVVALDLLPCSFGDVPFKPAICHHVLCIDNPVIVEYFDGFVDDSSREPLTGRPGSCFDVDSPLARSLAASLCLVLCLSLSLLSLSLSPSTLPVFSLSLSLFPSPRGSLTASNLGRG